MRRVLLLLLCTAIFCGVYLDAMAQDNAILQKIYFEKQAEDLSSVTFVVQGAFQRKVFMLRGQSPRLVVDLLGVVYHGDSKIAVLGSDLVRGIRIGFHTKPQVKTRVVVDCVEHSKVIWRESLEGQRFTLIIGTKAALSETAQVRSTSPASAVIQQPKKQNTTDLSSKKATVSQVKPVGRMTVVLPSVPQQKEQDVAAVSEDAVSLKEEETREVRSARPALKQKKPDPFAIPSFPPLEMPSATPTRKTKKEEKIQLPDVESIKPLSSHSPVATKKQQTNEAASVKKKSSVASLFNVTFQGSANGEDRVLFELDDFHPPIVSAIVGENPRVVCDFYKMRTEKKVLGRHSVSGKYVKTIRVSQHENPGKVRAVLDLIPGKDYALHQIFFNEDNMFVLAVKPLDVEEEAQ